MTTDRPETTQQSGSDHPSPITEANTLRAPHPVPLDAIAGFLDLMQRDGRHATRLGDGSVICVRAGGVATIRPGIDEITIALRPDPESLAAQDLVSEFRHALSQVCPKRR